MKWKRDQRGNFIVWETLITELGRLTLSWNSLEDLWFVTVRSECLNTRLLGLDITPLNLPKQTRVECARDEALRVVRAKLAEISNSLLPEPPQGPWELDIE